MTQQQNPPAGSRPNPFSGSGSRFGSSSPAPTPAQGNQPAPAPAPPPPRPGGLLSRVGTRLDWRILPVTGTIIHFTLDGLGDPFHRILGKRLMVDFGSRDAVLKVFESGGSDVAEIVTRLELAWKDYDLKGALLLYPWNDALRSVMGGRTPASDSNDDEENVTTYDEDKRQPPMIVRAVDPLLTLNVLARTRANILLPETPLSLEKMYLGMSLMSDDPRLIALTQGTGYVEEPLAK